MKATAITKLNTLAEEIGSAGYANVTRLTVIKKWLLPPGRSQALAVHTAKRVLAKGISSTDAEARELWSECVALFADTDPFAPRIGKRKAAALHSQLYEFQDEHQSIRWGSVRIIESKELFAIEIAISILLEPDRVDLGYKLVADQLGSYGSSRGTALDPSSLKDLRSLVQFMERAEAQERSDP